MMYEPFFWSKGVNDFLNGKNYSVYCSNDKDHMPTVPEATVLTLEEIKADGGYTDNTKVMGARDTVSNAYAADNAYAAVRVSVSGYKRVRFPTVPGTNIVGSVFADNAGKVVGSVVVNSSDGRFEPGMYVITEVPDGAVSLHFTIAKTAEFDKVVLSNSDRIEDMEPDWVANDAHLCGVVGSSIVGAKLRACITGGSTASYMTWTDFHYYSQQRGMQQIDALMHWRIANLAYAKYGRRDMQEQCGGGARNNMRTTGTTAPWGMTDTIGYTEAHTIDANITNETDAVVHRYAWYKEQDAFGIVKVTQVGNICCLGYEDIYGHKHDMMDRADYCASGTDVGKWRVWMPDGRIVKIKGCVAYGWITAVAHGKYMAVVPVGTKNGSSSTYYTDFVWHPNYGAQYRVIYRGGPEGTNAECGMAMAYANETPAGSRVNFGSRLAFRGTLVEVKNVEEYKAITEIA